MGFIEAVKTVLGKYATFSGRARRAEFWWFFLFVVIAEMITALIDSLLWTPVIDPTTNVMTQPQWITGLFSLLVLLPTLAVAARRLHDINRSGWWQFLGYAAALAAVALMALIAASAGWAVTPAIVWPMALPFIAWVVLLVWYCKRGDVGANRFGPDPINSIAYA